MPLPPQRLWLNEVRHLRGEIPTEISVPQRGGFARPGDLIAVAAGYGPDAPLLGAVLVFWESSCADLLEVERLARDWSSPDAG